MILFLVVCLGGCTFEEGAPWGTLSSRVSLSFDARDRLDTSSQRLRIGNGYQLDLSRLEVEVISLELLGEASAASGGGGTFDPASPPAGYSLCHNGHCHADDGRLVDYDAIRAELAMGGGATVSAPVVIQSIGEQVAIERADVQRELTPSQERCSSARCDLPRGALTVARVTLRLAALSGRVFDVSDRGRLPAEGLPVTGEVTSAPLVLSRALDDVVVGEQDLPELALSAQVRLSPSLFDGVDWSAVAREERTIQDELSERVSERVTLEVTTRWDEP